MSTRVLIVDDHRIVREGVRSLLDQQRDIEVVGEARDGREAVQRVGELRPQVVLMDVEMPNLNGVEATRQIKESHPGVYILALSMHGDRRFLSRILEAGASGYMLKESAFEELSLAITSVANGKVYLSPGVTRTVVDDYKRFVEQESSDDLPALTPRERETLQLIAEGKSTKEVAKILDVSVKTAETHRKRLMD